jgi:regulator of cell morphogenesis and NO signaling
MIHVAVDQHAQPEALSMLLREHREVEAHLNAARDWIGVVESEGAPALERLAGELERFGRTIRDDLALHIAHEDQALFPVLGRQIGSQTGPIAVMLMEHRALEGHERKYQEGLERGRPQAVADSAGAMVQVLTAHMWKEENVLFPLALRTLRPEEWQEVLDLMRTSA